MPLLIAADQEGGQLVGLGHETTRFPGAMALGAAGDAALTERVARATAAELRALGVTVCYAPVCDLAIDPRERQPRHARLRVGPGRGRDASGRVHARAHRRRRRRDAASTSRASAAVRVDPHHALGAIDRDRAELEARELVPVPRGVRGGRADGHVRPRRAARRSRATATCPRPCRGAVMHDLLRGDLGFRGVSITDAMDMRALAQGAAQVVEAIAALRAGVDLLLLTPDRAAQRRLEAGLSQAALRGLVPSAHIRAATARIRALRRWAGSFPGATATVIRSAAHEALALESASRAVTLVRDDDGLVPLRLGRASASRSSRRSRVT